LTLFISKPASGRWFSIPSLSQKFVTLFCNVKGSVRHCAGAGRPLQEELKLDPTPIAHRTHGLTPGNLTKYDARIAAIDYTLAHDDGSLRNLDQAQVILLGVSRCGKTPPACIWRCSLVFAQPTTLYCR
jgi:hypothetical protein